MCCDNARAPFRPHPFWTDPMPFRLIAPLLIAGFLLLMPVHAAAQIRLDLRDVDLRSYIQLVAEETQRNFLLDPDIDGTVSVYAPVSVTPAAMYEIFLNVLEMNGLTIVEGEGIDRILPMVNAAGMAPGVGQSRRGGAFETRVIPVVGDVDEMFEVLQPLVAQDGLEEVPVEPSLDGHIRPGDLTRATVAAPVHVCLATLPVREGGVAHGHDPVHLGGLEHGEEANRWERLVVPPFRGVLDLTIEVTVLRQHDEGEDNRTHPDAVGVLEPPIVHRAEGATGCQQKKESNHDPLDHPGLEKPDDPGLEPDLEVAVGLRDDLSLDLLPVVPCHEDRIPDGEVVRGCRYLGGIRLETGPSLHVADRQRLVEGVLVVLAGTVPAILAAAHAVLGRK